MSGSPELLVLSDLHLGGAIRPPFGFRELRLVAKLDREIARFVDWHRENPNQDAGGNDLPWTLILNGDTLDFLHMDLRPGKDTLEAPDEDEDLYGLDFDERRSRWKLAVMATYHRRSFQAFGRFCANGNKLVFVAGNHDADLFFKGVRADLAEFIAGTVEQAHWDTVRANVEFSPWFFLDEGRVWIEHGHRYDPYATFPDPLAPLSPEDRRLAPTFGHWALRYFCNRVPDFPIHDVDTWGVGDLIAWVRSHPWSTIFKATWSYFGFISRYAIDTARDRIGRDKRHAARRERRRKRLRTFARFYKMPLKKILALDRLKLPHVGESAGRLAQALFFDRMILIMVALVGLIASIRAFDGGAAFFSSLVVLSLSYWAWVRLAKMRPAHDVHPVLGRIAPRVGRIAGAPIVVFGHTHRPILRRVGRVRWLNPGSWEHLPRHRLHRADEPCTCHARFGMISGKTHRATVHLRRWCARVQAPHTLVSE